MMKKLVLIFVAALFISCQGESNTGNDSGTVPGAKDGTKVFVYNMMKKGGPVAIDTAVIKNEKFQVNIPYSGNQTLNSIKLENVRGNLLFIHSDTPISFTLYKDSIRSSIVDGGKHNALMKDYFDHVKKFGKELNNLRNQYQAAALKKDKEKIEAIKDQQKKMFEDNAIYQKGIVEKNPKSLVSLMILSDLLRAKQLPLPEVEKLYGAFPKELKETSIGKQIDKILLTASATAVGAKAPHFSGPTPSGENLALKDVLGKVTLVDFWASWCKPCRNENPNIVKVYKKYHDKGFNVIQVSLDKTKEKWVKAIENDGLTWHHVSNLKFWQGPIARQYNIRSIPAAFLLDENGVIIAKNLRGEELGEKVAEVLTK